MRILRIFVIVPGIASIPLTAQQPFAPYKDRKLTIEDRVVDLLSRMTLEENVAEITGGHRGDRGLVDASGQLHYTTAGELFKEMCHLQSQMSPRVRGSSSRLTHMFPR
jgi:hypothetical protein